MSCLEWKECMFECFLCESTRLSAGHMLRSARSWLVFHLLVMECLEEYMKNLPQWLWIHRVLLVVLSTFTLCLLKLCYKVHGASLVAQTVKNLPATQETRVWSLGEESPQRRAWQPVSVFLPGEYHGQRCLADYSPWAHKESDTTKRLT